MRQACSKIKKEKKRKTIENSQQNFVNKNSSTTSSRLAGLKSNWLTKFSVTKIVPQHLPDRLTQKIKELQEMADNVLLKK